MRNVPIHRFAVRNNLLLGCDRELVLVSAILAAAPALGTMNLKAGIYGVILWLVALFLLRRLAKYDPMVRHIYKQHIGYKSYYRAKSTCFSKFNKKY